MSAKNKRLEDQRNARHKRRRIKAVAVAIGIVVCFCVYLHYEMALRFVEVTSAMYGICELLVE